MTAHIAIINGVAVIWINVTILYFFHRIGTIMKRLLFSSDLMRSKSLIASKVEKPYADRNGLRFPLCSSL